MDYNKIKEIKMYSDQIRKFRNLENYKNLSNEKFSEEMKKLFPEFVDKNKLIFDSLVENKDMEFLDLMFHKLNEINKEYVSRKNEIELIREKIEDIRALLKVNENMNKEKLISFIESSSPDFVTNYPVIIDRLLDKETKDLSVENLFLDQVKFKYETQIGETLANKYIYPKINK